MLLDQSRIDSERGRLGLVGIGDVAGEENRGGAGHIREAMREKTAGARFRDREVSLSRGQQFARRLLRGFRRRWRRSKRRKPDGASRSASSSSAAGSDEPADPPRRGARNSRVRVRGAREAARRLPLPRAIRPFPQCDRFGTRSKVRAGTMFRRIGRTDSSNIGCNSRGGPGRRKRCGDLGHAVLRGRYKPGSRSIFVGKTIAPVGTSAWRKMRSVMGIPRRSQSRR